jgi:hypothetical protein
VLCDFPRGRERAPEVESPHAGLVSPGRGGAGFRPVVAGWRGLRGMADRRVGAGTAQASSGAPEGANPNSGASLRWRRHQRVAARPTPRTVVPFGRTLLARSLVRQRSHGNRGKASGNTKHANNVPFPPVRNTIEFVSFFVQQPPGADMSISRRSAILTMAASLGLSDRATAAETIKIGQIAPLTGPGAASASAHVNGAKLAVDIVNEQGGVVGKLLELVVEDDLSTAPGAVAAFGRLASRGDIVAV